jgi:hypothetical protein
MRLAQRLVEFLLDPVQGGEVDVILQFLEKFPLVRVAPGCRWKRAPAQPGTRASARVGLHRKRHFGIVRTTFSKRINPN